MSIVSFSCSAGGSIGVAVFGAILAAGVGRLLPAGGSLRELSPGMDTGTSMPQLTGEALAAFSATFHAMFAISAGVAVLILLLTLTLKQISLRQG